MNLANFYPNGSQCVINDEVFKLADCASKAVLYEVSAFPKPGLVSPISSGAHDDMNYFTFIDSTTALMKYFILFAMAGYSSKDLKEIFSDIRKIGIQAEADMFAATGKVNTHKGMIFLMGVSLAATAKVLYERQDFKRISSTIQEMTADLVLKDLHHLTKETASTHGEKLYVNHNITGIRGEVEDGLPIVFLHALPFFQDNKDLTLNNQLIQTLFKIMTICDDTTIIHRHNVNKLLEVKEKGKKILAMDGVRSKAGQEQLEQLCHCFIEERVSPGGSADLLAVTVFFDLVQESLFYSKN